MEGSYCHTTHGREWDTGEVQLSIWILEVIGVKYRECVV